MHRQKIKATMSTTYVGYVLGSTKISCWSLNKGSFEVCTLSYLFDAFLLCLSFSHRPQLSLVELKTSLKCC